MMVVMVQKEKELRVNRIQKSDPNEMITLAYQSETSQQTPIQFNEHQTKQEAQLYCPFVLFCFCFGSSSFKM